MININSTFRSAYADSNALWKVIEKKSEDVYLCEIVNEPVEYDGKVFDGDYAGTQKVFLSQEIERSIDFKKAIDKIKRDCDDYYDSLSEGQIVHYHNGFGEYVRCKINEDKKLVPFALVGNWRSYDLPKRLSDGTVNIPHHCKQILNQKPFKPSSSNIFEYPGFSNKNNFSPINSPEVNINIPEQTEEEKQTSSLWTTVNEIQKEISDNINRDPNVILSKIKEIVSNVKI
jgi:hypothetical protein